MTRVTRAALRSMEQHDESDNAASTPLPLTPVKGRVPLGEVTGNKGGEATNTSEEQAAPAKNGTGKGRRGNTTKKAKKQPREKAEGVLVEVMEDESQCIHSSAAEEACHLLKDGSQGMSDRPLVFDWPTSTPQVVLDDDRPHTPPSAAAKTASQQLSPESITPSSDPEVHEADDTAAPDGKDEKEDSFVDKIESRTPLKMTDNESMETPRKEENDKDDSFVEQIKAQTPGKRISRIEDSVEALDALEEEIEKVGGLIPASTDGLQFPAKAKKQVKPQSNTKNTEINGSLRTKKAETNRASTAVGPSASAGATNTRARPSTGLAQQKTDITTQAAGSTRDARRLTSQTILKKRISSVHKKPFQPTKSTKPPTRPNFELPGEAVARKLREQREERSKREEEETRKPRVFKVRSVRLSQAPEVKLTATTKARLSMAKGEPITRNGLNPKPVARPSPMTHASPNKRLSTLSVHKRSTQSTASGRMQHSTNRSARLTRGPSLSAAATVRAPSALGANRPPPTAEESAHQKLKGKEVFDRTKIEIMERGRAKKEKEDAASKARADAAERGRIASRAWAEKQKVRKLEAGKVSDQGKAAAA